MQWRVAHHCSSPTLPSHYTLPNKGPTPWHLAPAGGLSEEEAFKAAVKTWPPGVRPVVHWSESQPGRKPHAHSDYVRVRFNAQREGAAQWAG
jgi:hypothetical protein